MKSMFVKVIEDPNAPERLRGQTITATIVKGKLEFSTPVPDDATANELGYLRWWVGEFVDEIKKDYEPGFIGEQRAELIRDS